MSKNSKINGTEEIGLVTPSPADFTSNIFQVCTSRYSKYAFVDLAGTWITMKSSFCYPYQLTKILRPSIGLAGTTANQSEVILENRWKLTWILLDNQGPSKLTD